MLRNNHWHNEDQLGKLMNNFVYLTHKFYNIDNLSFTIINMLGKGRHRGGG